MKDIVGWVEKLRGSSHVKRVHTVPTIGEQTVGHHSFNVGILCIAIANGEPSSQLLQAAAFHDTHEIDGGDVPAHILWNNEVLHKELDRIQNEFRGTYGLHTHLSPKDELILEWADKLEFAFFCIDQIYMGNRYMTVPLFRAYGHMRNQMDNIGNASKILARVRDFIHSEFTQQEIEKHLQ